MRHLVRKIVVDTLHALKSSGAISFDSIPNFNVETPRDASHGDWSTNVAMTLSKAAKMKPQDLAGIIANGLVDPEGVLAGHDVVNGFINFRLKDGVFQNVARDILKAGNAWGRQPAKSTGKKVMVEFVSANPTGPVHIGHARGAFVGDALARLLDAAGHEVTREFYINDSGKQVETLGRTLHKRYRQEFGETVALAEGEYPGEYVKQIAAAWKAEIGDKYLKAPESEWLKPAIDFACRENLKAIRATLAMAGISHDVFFSEQSLHDSGKVKGVVDFYKARGVTYEAAEAKRDEKKVRNAESKAAQYADRQQGGTFLMTTSVKEAKDEEDRIILRFDGTPVYLTADLAYHKDKFDRGFDRVVDVFGADHAGHVPRIKAGVALMGVDAKKIDFVLVQIVKLVLNGEEVKVSKRKGTVYELSDLIEDAGADVCRFIFLMKTPNSQFDFDLGKVKEQSKDNPVFYFQYGHARCANVLKRAEEKGVKFNGAPTEAQLAKLTLPEERSMLKKMSQLPEMVSGAAEALEPHRVLYFCQELIAEFHGYYTQYKHDPIISADADKTQGRLALTAALKQTLKSAFLILGIDAPENMEAPEDVAL